MMRNPLMEVRFERKSDAAWVLKCIRDDGSATWQHRSHPHGIHHDLADYAVETVLGLSGGFYGIVASGWDIGTFEKQPPGNRIPTEYRRDALIAESFVSLLDNEGAGAEKLSYDDFTRWIPKYLDQMMVTEAVAFSPAQIAKLRDVWTSLVKALGVTPVGQALSLQYPASAA